MERVLNGDIPLDYGPWLRMSPEGLDLMQQLTKRLLPSPPGQPTLSVLILVGACKGRKAVKKIPHNEEPICRSPAIPHLGLHAMVQR